MSRYTFVNFSTVTFILFINQMLTFLSPRYALQINGTRRIRQSLKELTLWGQDNPSAKPKLLDQVRIACRRMHYSPKTEKSYVFWNRQLILFHNMKHPKDMGKTDIESYLNHLAVKKHVSASTQSDALNAIAFLFREVLVKDMPCLDKLRRIKRKQNIPVVMSANEISATFELMHGTTRLMAELIYGTG